MLQEKFPGITGALIAPLSSPRARFANWVDPRWGEPEDHAF